LFEEVRTNRGLAYSVSARPGNSRVNTGSLFVFSIDIAQAVAVMFEEVKKMKEQKVEQDEIDLQIKKYLSSWYMGRETRSQQSNILAFYELMGIGWENSGSFIHRLQRVDADAIQRAMTKHLRDMSVAVVGQVKPDISPILRKHQALSSAPPEASTE
ncbi:MAG: insulinase family protein, partial [Bradymonadales bacterium]